VKTGENNNIPAHGSERGSLQSTLDVSLCQRSQAKTNTFAFVSPYTLDEFVRQVRTRLNNTDEYKGAQTFEPIALSLDLRFLCKLIHGIRCEYKVSVVDTIYKCIKKAWLTIITSYLPPSTFCSRRLDSPPKLPTAEKSYYKVVEVRGHRME
jgi:hypothetical protein